MDTFRSLPHTAVRASLSTIRALLDSGADVHERDENGRTALFRTCRIGQTEKACMLLAAGSDPNATDMKGEAPLQSAARYGHIECVEALLRAGAVIDYCPPPSVTDYSETALCSAVRKCPEIARLLLSRGADPNWVSEAKNYPLFCAIQHPCPDLVELLIQHKAEVGVRNLRNESALHLAMRTGNAAIIKTLLKAGADSNAMNDDGESPIFPALYTGDVTLPAVQEWLKSGPDLTLRSTNGERTALEEALAQDAKEIAAALVQAGAPPARIVEDISEGIFLTFDDLVSDNDLQQMLQDHGLIGVLTIDELREKLKTDFNNPETDNEDEDDDEDEEDDEDDDEDDWEESDVR